MLGLMRLKYLSVLQRATFHQGFMWITVSAAVRFGPVGSLLSLTQCVLLMTSGLGAYAWRNRHQHAAGVFAGLTPPVQLLLLAFAIVTTMVAFTDDQHHWFWRQNHEPGIKGQGQHGVHQLTHGLGLQHLMRVWPLYELAECGG
jgi:hypothetical protein